MRKFLILFLVGFAQAQTISTPMDINGGRLYFRADSLDSWSVACNTAVNNPSTDEYEWGPNNEKWDLVSDSPDSVRRRCDVCGTVDAFAWSLNDSSVYIVMQDALDAYNFLHTDSNWILYYWRGNKEDDHPQWLVSSSYQFNIVGMALVHQENGFDRLDYRILNGSNNVVFWTSTAPDTVKTDSSWNLFISSFDNSADDFQVYFNGFYTKGAVTAEPTSADAGRDLEIGNLTLSSGFNAHIDLGCFAAGDVAISTDEMNQLITWVNDSLCVSTQFALISVTDTDSRRRGVHR